MKKKFIRLLSTNKIDESLKGLIFIITLHAIAPAIFIIIFLILGQRETAVITYKTNLVQVANLSAHHYEHEFLQSKQIQQILSELPEIKNHDKAGCEKIVKSIFQSIENDNYSSIGAIDKNGNSFCSSPSLNSNLNVSDRDYFQSVKEKKTFILGGYSVGKLSGNPQIVTGYPILDSNGDFNGITGIAINVKWLNRLAESVDLPDGYTITVLDQNGIIISRFPEPEKWIGKDIKETNLGTEILSKSRIDQAFTANGLDETKRLYAISKAEAGASNGDAYVAIGAPESEISRIANQNIIREALIIIIVILAAVLILSFDLYYIRKKISSNRKEETQELSN